MDNKIHKYELYTADFYESETSTIYKHIAYADTFEEAIEILVKKQDCHRSDPKEYNKIVNEIRSHSESELKGCEEIRLYGGCCYYHEYLRKVPGYVDEDEVVSKDVTLGEILKRELANVKDLKGEMRVDTKNKEDFYHDQDKEVPGSGACGGLRDFRLRSLGERGGSGRRGTKRSSGCIRKERRRNRHERI